MRVVWQNRDRGMLLLKPGSGYRRTEGDCTMLIISQDAIQNAEEYTGEKVASKSGVCEYMDSKDNDGSNGGGDESDDDLSRVVGCRM